MDSLFKYLIIFIETLALLPCAWSDTYSAQIWTESHVNLVDSKFLSFTIDPKYLFTSSNNYNSKHCLCMASSLTPAYLRIAGPSTSRMVFDNFTIYMDNYKDHDKLLSPISGGRDRRMSMSHKQWGKFVRWAQKTGFNLVFALDNEEKMASDMWDPHAALGALTVAEKANVSDVVWQLGYECTNQTIEEYLNDLETLRVIVETFIPAKRASWRVVAGDISPCLQANSKSDFKDYVTLSNDMLDAIFLNGNSSAIQLEKMSESDRLKLLKFLSRSETPLWLTEKVQPQYNELERAADWLASLGYSARNGFSVHFRELVEGELHEPTLSFYMALLYKNLVGERVLDVNMTVSQATMFAHCTSLRHKPVSGAVTLYGANMDDEPARFSIKLSKKEDGGDIMQFILGHDNKGNIVVNGRAMYLEGDIRPAVKRVRPFRTLLLNLPPKSFGFWVLANTRVDACIYKDELKKEFELFEALPVEEDSKEAIDVVKAKRSIRKRDANSKESIEFLDEHHSNTDSEVKSEHNYLRKQIDNLNEELKNFYDLVNERSYHSKDELPSRTKRQTFDAENGKNPNKKGFRSKLYKNVHGKRFDFKPRLLDKLLQLKDEKLSQLGKFRFRKTSKRSCPDCSEEYMDEREEKRRKRRSAVREQTLSSLEDVKRSKVKKYKSYKESTDNEIDAGEDYSSVGRIFQKLKGTIRNFPVEIEEELIKADDKDLSDNEISLHTKLSNDEAFIDIRDKTNPGLLRSTFEDLVSLVADLNKHLNRFWNTFTFLE
ncbi:heparanase [Battus philenor]|uniref:heparanase n=1 Tax=Battus philenor TaxID=42288 RepID=UPI0035CF66AA